MIDTSQIGNTLSDEQIAKMAEWISVAVEGGDKEETLQRLGQMKTLSAIEMEAVRTILRERKRSGSSAMWDLIWQIDYERLPVPFSEWCEDPYYSGGLHKSLWPVWKKELSYVCHPQSGVVEWILSGGIGSGKTHTSLIAQLYKIYFLSCLKCPQTYFGGEGEGGLSPTSEIVFALYSVNLVNAIKDFSQIGSYVKGSSYFHEHCPCDIKKGICRIEFPSKRIILRTGSSDLHAIGQNLFGYVLDEANFMGRPKERTSEEYQAHKIYYQSSRRIKSRFMRHGVIPGLACIASSKASETAFTEQLVKDNVNNPSFHVSEYAVWQTKGRETYSPRTFRVAVGNRYRKSEVLDEVLMKSTNRMEWEVDPSKAKTAPEGLQIEYVPVDWYPDFIKNTDQALRDIAGVATMSASPLIWRTESVHECYEGFPYPHPFLKEVHELSMDDPDSDLLKCVDWRKLGKIVRGVWTPSHHPDALRFMHVDLGLTGDAAAISMGCGFDSVSMANMDHMTGQVSEVFYPKVWVDFMIRIKPVRGEQIDLAKIVAFILNLRYRGFYLQRVTFDGFASEMAIQIIKKSNQIPDSVRRNRSIWDEKVKLESGVLSVDKDDRPYSLLRDMLFQNAVKYYKYDPFIDEILSLEHNRDDKKVDHRPGGSKDVSDSLAGMVYGVATSRNYVRSSPVEGIAGDKEAATTNLEDDMMGNILADYPERGRITSVAPPPVPEPRDRKLDTNRSSWIREIPGIGR